MMDSFAVKTPIKEARIMAHKNANKFDWLSAQINTDATVNIRNKNFRSNCMRCSKGQGGQVNISASDDHTNAAAWRQIFNLAQQRGADCDTTTGFDH